MKINRSILLAVLGLGVAAAAQAGDVYLTGSTAVRGDIFTTLSTPGAVFQAPIDHYRHMMVLGRPRPMK